MTSETTKAEKPSQLMRWLRHLPALLGVGLLFGAIYVVQHEFRHLRLAEIKRALHSFSWHSLGWALVCWAALQLSGSSLPGELKRRMMRG